MASQRIVLTGGGTGGHVYPALAVAEVLKEDPDVEAILYIGVTGHLEERLAAERGLQFHGIKVSGLPRRFSPALFTWPFEMLNAINKAKALLKEFKPTAILGTGGYASAPPLAAAQMMNIPYAVHEPDAHPGLVNKVFAKQASLVSVGMEAAADILKSERGPTIFNGNPVRNSFVKALGRDAACAVLGLDHTLKTILVTGGSQGAQAINEAVVRALPDLLEHDPPIQVIHQAGDKNAAAIKENLDRTLLLNKRYHLRPYFEDLSTPYAACDMAICRAGAMTIAELAVTGTPALFIPYPFAAADHQTHNANFLAAKGAAEVLPQSQLTAESFKSKVMELMESEERLKNMRQNMRALGKPQAAEHLAQRLKAISR
jgi:UDP-N-acetylglucosamine--N-acetylmuramyl-(pentapeptide) pyrophosphoryl-undecaprenol N-acetylglucosamine transferase